MGQECPDVDGDRDTDQNESDGLCLKVCIGLTRYRAIRISLKSMYFNLTFCIFCQE